MMVLESLSRQATAQPSCMKTTKDCKTVKFMKAML